MRTEGGHHALPLLKGKNVLVSRRHVELVPLKSYWIGPWALGFVYFGRKKCLVSTVPVVYKVSGIMLLLPI